VTGFLVKALLLSLLGLSGGANRKFSRSSQYFP